MKKDDKEIFPTIWVNYEYLDNSFVGQYFTAGCNIITITMATLKVHKNNLQSSVSAIYLKNWVCDLPFLLHFWKAS